jgi:hypothetical protein
VSTAHGETQPESVGLEVASVLELCDQFAAARVTLPRDVRAVFNWSYGVFDSSVNLEPSLSSGVVNFYSEEDTMGLGRGALLWLLGVPLPIIILLVLFWHH